MSKTYERLSAQTGLPASTIKSRLRSMPLERALESGDLRGQNGADQPFKYVWNGCKGVKKIAASVGVSHATLHKYINLANGDIEGAVQLIHERDAEIKARARNKRLREERKKKRKAKKPKLLPPKPNLGLWAIALGLCKELPWMPHY